MRDGFIAWNADRSRDRPGGRDLHIEHSNAYVTCFLDSKCFERITYEHIIVVNVLEIRLPSRLESVEEAAAKTAQFAQERHLDAEMTNALDMSVRESVANAVKHGNRFDAAKQIELTVTDGDDAVEVTVRDFGAGFDVDSVPDPTNPENLMTRSS